MKASVTHRDHHARETPLSPIRRSHMAQKAARRPADAPARLTPGLSQITSPISIAASARSPFGRVQELLSPTPTAGLAVVAIAVQPVRGSVCSTAGPAVDRPRSATSHGTYARRRTRPPASNIFVPSSYLQMEEDAAVAATRQWKQWPARQRRRRRRLPIRPRRSLRLSHAAAGGTGGRATWRSTTSHRHHHLRRGPLGRRLVLSPHFS